MGEFRMPSLGADMTEGRLVEWHVGPGDEVRHGDIVATVDTSKAEVDIEIFEDGIVDELVVPVGETVAVGTPLAVVRPLGGPVGVPAGPPPDAAVPAGPVPPPAPASGLKLVPTAAPPHASEPARPAVPAPTVAARPADGHRPRVSPLARRTAERLGVDLARVSGTGPRGAICAADVDRAAGSGAPSAAAAPPPSTDRASAMRQSIAALMARSKREIPHYYLATDIDLRPVQAWLERHNRERTLAGRVVPAAVLLAACARAAARFPELNGFFLDGALQPAGRVHLGVAIALRGGGLVAPAIHDADGKTVDELMSCLHDLVRRARSGGLRGSELADPTITVTNLGDQGVPTVYGVIYPPQVALVGFGAIRDRPWADSGMLAVRPVVTATLSGDHRAGDGHRGGLLLSEIDRLLQAPEDL